MTPNSSYMDSPVNARGPINPVGVQKTARASASRAWVQGIVLTTCDVALEASMASISLCRFTAWEKSGAS